MSDDIKKSNGEEYQILASSDLKYILDVNRKSVELYLEVERQNEEVLDKLERLDDLVEEVSKSKTDLTEELDKLKGIADSIRATSDSNRNLLIELKPKIEDIKNDLFRLVVFLGIIGAGTIFQILQLLFHK